MVGITGFALLICIGLVAYLAIALLKPEMFS